MDRETLVSALQRQHGLTPAEAMAAADRYLNAKPRALPPKNFLALSSPPPTSIGDTARRWTLHDEITAEQMDVAVSAPIRAKRTGGALWMEILTAPRTKKNHAETLGSQKSKQYKRYCAELVEAIACVRDVLALPLPDLRPHGYNCRALFYVDKWGERADRVGLEQGLYDALQAAGVVSDDWVFRQGDGTRVIADQRARVEFWIEPLSPSPARLSGDDRK